MIIATTVLSVLFCLLFYSSSLIISVDGSTKPAKRYEESQAKEEGGNSASRNEQLAHSILNLILKQFALVSENQ
jgi:hypothetical protein